CDYAGARPGFSSCFSLVCAPAQTMMNVGHANIFFLRASVSPFIVLYWFWYRYTTEHVITSGVPEAESL
ncbi:hypothetical protein, partial [Schaedlerella arabinosiphila]|uniref:hypothetical protein n=1 Tax=Schaedlerella arabinosiphila TaxID=2044587 RepID=UPI001A9A9479